MNQDCRHIRTGADIRAKLDHPVVDADGHIIETTFAVLDFVKQVGGPELAGRYETLMRHDGAGRNRGAVWVGNSGPCRSRNPVAVETRAFRRHPLTLLFAHNGGEDHLLLATS